MYVSKIVFLIIFINIDECYFSYKYKEKKEYKTWETFFVLECIFYNIKSNKLNMVLVKLR